MKYFEKIPGERLYLSPMSEDDAEIYTKWLNDRAVSENLGQYRTIISLSNERSALSRLSSDGHNYAIVLREGHELIGNISLMEHHPVNRRATLGIFIGEAERRGRGYGAEAIGLILRYGFDTLNLHNVMLQLNSDNLPALACYKKAGFREFGRRRESSYKDGRYVDTVYMEILEGEFRARDQRAAR